MPLSPDTTAIVINRHSGTVRSMGAEKVAALIRAAWPEAQLDLLDGSEIDAHLRKLLGDRNVKHLIVGGGDGTVASAAGLLAGTDVALGVLPLGTLNMIAQTLGMERDLSSALAQLRAAEEKHVDAGRAGGRLFLHHVSFGIQPRLVRLRERLGYSSRFTKMLAGARAFLAVVFNPQSMRLRLAVDEAPVAMKTPALIVSNNVYADRMMLTQERLDEGILGLYALSPMPLLSYLRLAIDLMRGRWRNNLNVTEMRPREVVIAARRAFGRNRRGIKATLDGELVLFELPLQIASEPAALRMLVPRAAEP